LEEQLGDDHDQTLLLLDTTPGLSQAKIAEALGWVSEHGPDKAKVNRALAALVKHRLAEKDMRGKYSLTEKGKKVATKLRKGT
jgi:DNA-binding IclR family transcriptional regulator